MGLNVNAQGSSAQICNIREIFILEEAFKGMLEWKVNYVGAPSLSAQFCYIVEKSDYEENRNGLKFNCALPPC